MDLMKGVVPVNVVPSLCKRKVASSLPEWMVKYMMLNNYVEHTACKERKLLIAFMLSRDVNKKLAIFQSSRLMKG